MYNQNDELLARLKSIEVQDASYHAKNPALVFDRAKGSVIWDVEGKEYLDFCAGFGVQALGHNPDVIVNYFKNAFNSDQPPIVHGMGDVYSSRSKIEFCEMLLSLMPKHLKRVSLSLGGGQAIEYAVKTAILKTKQSGFICFKGSYHGLDFAPLALTYKEWFKKDFSAWLPHQDSVQFLPYACDEKHLENKIVSMKAQTSGCAAVIVEPIQGRSGCVIPPAGWLQMLRKITRKHHVLLIYDEIFVGMGRCGFWTHAALENCDADIVCFGKAIGASLPLSACVGSEEVMSAWPENEGEAIHTGTFFGHPLSCKLGSLLLSQMIEHRSLFADVMQKGVQLRSKLSALKKTCPHIKEIRGVGLMNVIEYSQPNMGAVVMDSLRAQSIIALASGEFGQCIAFTPALNIEAKYFDALVHALERAHLCF